MLAKLRQQTALLAAVLVLAAVAGFTFAEGRVGWTEVSRRTLAHRGASHHAIPILDLQVTPTVHGPAWRPPLAEHLAVRGLLDADDGPSSEWDLVKGFAWGVRGWRGAARRTCQELRCWDGEDERWIDWSERNPELAAALWPFVVEAIRRGDHDAAALALGCARGCPDVASLQSAIAR